MSNPTHLTPEEADEILLSISEHAHDIADKIDVSDDHAALYFGARYIEQTETNKEGVETYLMAVGFFGILAEGLYSELRDQIESGETELFSVIRDVVHDLEEDLNIEPDDFGIEDDTPKLLH